MSVGDFLERVHETVDESLRTAAWHDGDQVGVLYVRADLDRADAEERVRAIVEGLPGRWGPTASGLGPVSSSIQVRPDSLCLHVPLTPRSGIVLTLESVAIDHLPSIVSSVPEAVAEGGVPLRGGGDGGSKRCPSCGSTNYEVRSSRPGRPRTQSPGRFHCRYCGEDFDTPVVAESRLSVLEDE